MKIYIQMKQKKELDFPAIVRTLILKTGPMVSTPPEHTV